MGCLFVRETHVAVPANLHCVGVCCARDSAGLVARLHEIPKQRVFVHKKCPMQARLKANGHNRKCGNETMPAAMQHTV